jgi:hypothetical protein
MDLRRFGIFIEEFYKLMAADYNITVNKKSDFKRSFQLKEDNVIVDLTDYSVAGALKENYRATTSVAFTASVTDAAAGLFDISLTDTVTTDMDPGTWVYDIVLTDPSGIKTRLLEGRAFVKAGVTG